MPCPIYNTAKKTHTSPSTNLSGLPSRNYVLGLKAPERFHCSKPKTTQSRKMQLNTTQAEQSRSVNYPLKQPPDYKPLHLPVSELYTDLPEDEKRPMTTVALQ